jgi:hypothetical protein
MQSDFYASIHVVKFIILPLSLYIIAIPEISGLQVFEHCPLSGILRNTKNTVFQKLDLFIGSVRKS